MAGLVGLIAFLASLFAAPPVCRANIYWADKSNNDVVRSANNDGTNAQILVHDTYMPYDVAVDPVNGHLYFPDSFGSIYRCDLNGANLQFVVNGTVTQFGIALDLNAGKIYWTDQFKISRSNLDGSSAEDVITGLTYPIDVVVDPSGGNIYWTDRNLGQILRSDLNGANQVTLISGLSQPQELDLDLTHGHIYWAERGAQGYIRRADLDGTNMTTVISGLGLPYGVAVDPTAGKIYFTDELTTEISRANLDGSNQEILLSGSWPQGISLDTTAAPATYAVSGTVFEDVNYGGGSGRSLAAASGVGRPNVTVELYDNTGAYLGNTTTASDGSYSFNGLTAALYTVRVLNSTVTSSRSGSTGAEVAVQTFRADGYGETAGAGATKVGGEQPASTDAPANSGFDTLAGLQAPAGQYTQSIVSVNISSSDVTGVDFGFNFDTVVNTNDSGQGSLRQFMLNANLLANTGLDQDDWAGVVKDAGVEHSIFMIPLTDSGYGGDPTGGSGNAFVIQVSSASLPDITDIDTAIDGRTQRAFTGDTNGTVTNTSTGPEVVIDYGGTLKGYVFHFQSVRGHLYNLGVYRGGDGALNKGAVFFDNVATSGSKIFDLTVYQSSGHGFQMSGSTGILLAYSVLRSNGTDQTGACGVTMTDSSSNEISHSAMVNNASQGFELWSGACNDNLIFNNVIEGNGQSGAGSGIGLFAGSGNTISVNTITNNLGDGITVNSASTNNFITQNLMYANSDLGIDLGAGSSYDGDGVTLNDAGDGDTGGNDLVNTPVITSAVGSGGTININLDLDVPAGNYRIEFFKNPSGADPSGYGEGESYVGSVAVSHTGSGLESFSHSFAGTAGDLLTATAIVDLGGGNFGATSEFSAVYTATAATPAITITKSVAPISDPLNGTNNPIIIPGAVLQYSLTVTNQGPGSSDSDTLIITNPVGSDNTLFVGDLAGAGSGPVSFADGTPASGLSYTFSALASTTDNLSFSNDNGVTYSYTPVPDADGYDANVTHLRVTPSGVLAASDGTNHPAFTIQFRVRVR